MSYWLMKSEPSCFSIDDLQQQTVTHWDGVRNYQARNFMRDQMALGDLAFFYHSNTAAPGIVGIMEVTRLAYPDHSAWNPDDEHYDPKSSKETPRWWMVDVTFKEKLKQPILLNTLRQHPGLREMQILQKGNRLSITPLKKMEWDILYSLSH